MKNIFFFWVVLLAGTFPAYSGVAILNGLTHTHQVQAGGQLTEKITVKNDGRKEARIVIYKQDLVFPCGGAASLYTESGSHTRSFNTWIKTNVEEKLLAPGEEYNIYYTIQIPSGPDNAGSYWTLLMVEGADPLREENSNGMVVNSKVRYGVQIIADVGAYQSPQLNFLDAKILSTPAKTKYLSARIQNAGTFSASVKVNLEIYNAAGQKIKTLEAITRRIYPDNCNQFEIDLGDLPPGKYESILVADNGKDLFGTNVSLEI